MDKLGLYINNLMATVVDKEDKHFVRKLAFNELQKLNHDIGSFLINHDGTFNNVPEELKQKDKNQIQIEFGDKNENK